MPEKAILVTGGAGYIGSHAVLSLLEAGYRTVVLDDLSTGNKSVVPPDSPFIEGNAGDHALVADVLREFKINAVMHFAGSIIVEESVSEPLKYYKNNTQVSRDLIETCVLNHVDYFIFSSTAAVYGNPLEIPVKETTPLAPINPYGHSKAMTEQILKDVSRASSLKFIALRYFNVCGADPEGRSGQMTKQSTHLIKVACELATGKRQEMSIFGNDYDTPDGTCVRDYIHVSDLADIHVKALDHLFLNQQSQIINCGYGKGYSVKEVLDTLQDIVVEPLNIKQADRRTGDPVMLIADNSRLLTLINWKARYNDLKQILEDALEWEEKLNQN